MKYLSYGFRKTAFRLQLTTIGATSTIRECCHNFISTKSGLTQRQDLYFMLE